MFELEVIPDIKNVKNLSESQQKRKKVNDFSKKISPTDQLILLTKTERISLALILRRTQKKMNLSKTLVFVIGGPYGFLIRSTPKQRFRFR
jgi:23S rRNA (pseudouridine1915-N3)-methyltransferase